MHTRTLATLALAAGALLTSATAAATECTVDAPCVMRISTVAPRGTPWAQQLDRLKNRIEEESGGRIDVRTFLGASEGEVSLARQCKDGALEGVGVSTGAIAELVPQMGVFELPFLFDSPEQADRVIDNALAQPISDVLSQNGFLLYIFSENGFRNFATSGGHAVHSGADLATLQMRSQESWIHEEMYRALGGHPVSIPVTEVSSALSSGNVQGFDNTPLYSQAAGWHEFIDTWTVSNHIYQPAVVVYNKAWFDGLPADLQAVLTANRAEETRRGRRDIRALNPMLIQNFTAFGVTVYTMTASERQAMATATHGVYDMFRTRVPGGGQLLDLVLANR
ncbi:MAG: TRAP transporter substrate-binding protein [Myxococcales bacterium]|nr:TRAP transporter substrate-binding protein [Myxococcales bacterium]MCB9532342.1 TRAP transporter substrate-binding protein [Myxococcales bacterium]